MKKIIFYMLTLVLLSAACKRAAETPADPQAGNEAAPAEAQAGTVILTPKAVAGGGIAVEAARTIELARTIKAIGELEFDARRVAGVAARTAGRIEQLSAYAGEKVLAGAVLAEIYSPDYQAVQTEVLQAAARVVRLKGQPEETAARSFLDAARRKLAPFGPSPAEIDALVASGEPRPLLAVRTPIGGVVLESKAVAGAAVAEGADLFRLADPSSLWACVHLTEKDLATVRTGMEATIRTQAYPGREFRGRLVLVGASMDASTRTVEGRIVLPNPDGSLKPGMYVEAALASNDRRPVLTIPASAVQEFASGRIVFVQTGPTSFTLRSVATGENLGPRVEILAGLAEGELVVTAGSFLLKSEMLKTRLGN
jgi:Cu(I)/Ag(I) efflux system membrane fusion protein